MTNRMYQLRVTACALLAGGMVFSSSCSTDDVRMVLAGINAVTDALTNSDGHHEDISFGDWLMDEFD